MGLISQHNLTIAPPFYVSQVDLAVTTQQTDCDQSVFFSLLLRHYVNRQHKSNG